MRRAPLAALAAVLLAAIVTGCGSREGHDMSAMGRAEPVLPRTWEPPVPVPDSLADGRTLFQANCVRCHGGYALGTDQGPPLLHPFYAPSHHVDEAFQVAVAYGVRPHHWNFGPMPPVPGDLTRDQISRIVAYVRWLQHQAGIH